MVVDHDVEILALGGSIAGLGNSASPVADDQGGFVVGEPRFERKGLDGVFTDGFVPVKIHLDHRVAIGGDDVKPLAVARDGHSARHWIARGVFRLDRDLDVGLELARVVLKRLDRSGVGADKEPLAVGRPSDPSKTGVRLIEFHIRPRSNSLRIEEEDLGLIQNRKDFVGWMLGDIDGSSVEGDRAWLDPLSRGDEESAVGLLAHPDDSLTRGSGEEDHKQGEKG